MFSTHNINSNTISIRNLILLFLTIVLGFASVITLANIDILSNIENARQTIAKITVTADGTNVGELEMEVSSAGIYINTGILHEQVGFSGRVLGIDDNGNLVYAFSENLVVAGGGGGGHRTGNGTDIRNINPGNVGIGTPAMSGKLHIKGAGTTDVYIEETNAGNAANINLRNTTNTWMIGGYSDRFYLGLNGAAFLNIIPSGYVGIGTTGPKAPLQVIGNFIAGGSNNIINGSIDSTIAGGSSNEIYNLGRGFIGGGINNTLSGTYNSFVGGGVENGIYKISGDDNANVIGGGSSNNITGTSVGFIGGGNSNSISGSDYSFIGGGAGNTISGGSYNFIGGGASNSITGGSSYSSIIGGELNNIIGSSYSFAGGRKAIVLDNYSFVRNSDITTSFSTTKSKTFIINAPNGVGIRTNNPQGDLHVAGSGVVVFQPQINNPQLTASRCTTAGSVVFHQSANKLCYCNGSNRLYVDTNTTCIF